MPLITVIGAGVLGQLVGARLLARGHSVSFVVRPGREADLLAGISLHEFRRSRADGYFPTAVTSRTADALQSDWILATVRADQVDELLAALGFAALRRVVVFSPLWQTPNVDPVAARVAPGVAAYLSGRVIRYLRVTTRLSGPRAREAAKLLSDAGFRCRVVGDVAASTRAELAVGIPYAAAMEGAGFDFDRLRADPILRSVAVEGAAEAARVLRRTTPDHREGRLLLRLLPRLPAAALDQILLGAIGLGGRELREFIGIHTRKIQAQTRGLLDDLVTRAASCGLEVPSLKALQALPTAAAA